jgi:hypothetical protein
MNYNIENYLDESQLGLLLKDLYPNVSFIHNKQVPNSGIQGRPDYRSDELMLIVEYDGAQHYQRAINVLRDMKKDIVYKLMGYKVIRLPYFIQPTTETIRYYFGIESSINSKFPLGFISKDLILPCDYCKLGLDRFYDEIEALALIRMDDPILDSLFAKIQFNDVCTIVPPRLYGYYTKVDKNLLATY